MIRHVTRCRHCGSVEAPSLAIEIDTVARVVRANGKAAHLMPATLQVLRAIAERPGELVMRDRIFHAVWGADPNGGPSPKGMDVHICRIRDALAEIGSPARIETVHGRGFRIVSTQAAACLA